MNNNMDEWFKQILSNKTIVDQLLNADSNAVSNILGQFDEQKVEEIKICADMLSHKDKKYLQVADVVNDYQAKVGHHPDFGK